MTMCALDKVSETSESEGVSRRLVNLSRATSHDIISVAGPASLDLLSLICRDNFERVQCARQATCAAANDASDVLIMVGRMSGCVLPEQLQRTVRLLRDGGVLAVQLTHLDDDVALQRWLDDHGFDVASTVFDLSHEVLVAHHLLRRPALRAAA
jgi:hypothetical protein